jgi:hypothetical protein
MGVLYVDSPAVDAGLFSSNRGIKVFATFAKRNENQPDARTHLDLHDVQLDLSLTL